MDLVMRLTPARILLKGVPLSLMLPFGGLLGWWIRLLDVWFFGFAYGVFLVVVLAVLAFP